MNIKQMTAFRELMLTGSVSEAARNLNRTQPSISHLIATLEVDLGITLFARRGGRLHPVPEAHYLFKECQDLLHRLDTISQNMKRIKEMEQGELRIVSMPGPSVFLLPDLISQHVGAQPEVKATLLSRSSDAVFQLVGGQQFDLGIADHDPKRIVETSLVNTDVFRFDCLCALHADNPLATRPIITPEDLDERPMATLYQDHRSFELIAKAFTSMSSTMNVRFVTQYFIPLLTYVERGQASAIVDPLTIETYRRFRGDSGNVVFVPFKPVIDFSVAMLTPAYRPSSLLASAFAERLTVEFQRIGGTQAT